MPSASFLVSEKFADLWVEYFASKSPDRPRKLHFQSYQNGTLEITREKFGELWVEYFASEDPSAPGNFIFGVTKFE
ncbi:hypothetical protein J6590_100956 [Homalodisca vitripennis]|nr:hypothetical protein J6590_093647 [Homalodisca vitripennis]KAG8294542.1 hypothetical protein J6590_100956 [Homalodisca vitripennis]